MIAHIRARLALWRYRMALPARLALHKAIREARAAAAKRGQRTEWKRRAANARKLFG